MVARAQRPVEGDQACGGQGIADQSCFSCMKALRIHRDR